MFAGTSWQTNFPISLGYPDLNLKAKAQRCRARISSPRRDSRPHLVRRGGGRDGGQFNMAEFDVCRKPDRSAKFDNTMAANSSRRWTRPPGGHCCLCGNNIRDRAHLCVAAVLHERLDQPCAGSVGLVHTSGSCKDLPFSLPLRPTNTPDSYLRVG